MKIFQFELTDKKGRFHPLNGTVEASTKYVAIAQLRDEYSCKLKIEPQNIEVKIIEEEELIIGQEYYGYDPVCTTHFEYMGKGKIKLLNARANVIDVHYSLAPEFQNKIVELKFMSFDEIITV